MEIQREKFIAGVDEAGRGPLAGPVIAAAVILHPRKKIKGLADSKQLSATKREQLFIQIRAQSLAWSAAKATVSEIDEVNILQATFLAMQRAVKGLKIEPHKALIDGNMCPVLACETEAIIKGDCLEACISAASIVAKVLRDRIMCMLDKKYPNYGFAQHKGYATAQHFAALKQHGPSRIHRRSFSPITEWYKQCSLPIIEKANHSLVEDLL